MAMITTTTIKSIQKNNLNLKFCLRSIRNAQFRVCHVYSFFSKRYPMNIYNVTIYNKITKFQANHQSTATTHSQKKKKTTTATTQLEDNQTQEFFHSHVSTALVTTSQAEIAAQSWTKKKKKSPIQDQIQII